MFGNKYQDVRIASAPTQLEVDRWSRMLVSSIIGADVFDDERSELQRLKTGRIGGVLDSLNDVADRHLAYGQLVFFK